MDRMEPCWTMDGFTLRPGRPEDAEAYYAQNFCPLDSEVARLTGSPAHFTREAVVSFYLNCLDADDRYDFLLIAPDGRIIGESVINEMDREARSANYRVCIFHAEECGRGIGTWMVKATRDFAFGDLRLHRLFLNVLSINPRAERVYRNAGFRREGVLRDAVRIDGAYADDILMAILEDEWHAIGK